MVLTSLIATATILTAPVQDDWKLKAPFVKDYEATYVVKVSVEDAGQPVEAKFNQIIKIKDGGNGKPWTGTVQWDDIHVNDEPVDEQPTPWETTWQADGSISSVKSDYGDDLRRMLSPFAFLYTEKPVKKGDAWRTQVKPDTKTAPITEYTYEALGKETTDGKDTMKFRVSVKEIADSGVSGDGTWWLGMDGKVEKFEMHVQGWLVPMANGQRMSATISGKLK